MITRCPACETSFRITEAQLNTAKGAVRCGSCLQIFKAMDNLLPPRSADKNIKAQPEQSQVEPAQPQERRLEMPSFEYKKPASTDDPTRIGTAATRQPAPTSNEELFTSAENEADTQERPIEAPGELQSNDSPYDEDSDWQYGLGEESVSEGDGQENMLRFDQSAIDARDEEPEVGLLGDDMLISDEMLLDEDQSEAKGSFSDDLDDNFLDLDNWKPEDKPLFDRPKSAKQKDDGEDQQDLDESWAIDLLEEDNKAASPASSPTSTKLASKPSADPETASDPFEELGIEEAEDDDENSQVYSRAATGSFSALGPDESGASGSLRAGIDSTWDGADSESSLSSEYADAYDDYLGEDDDYSDRRELLRRIEPEPVEFAFYQGRSWRKTLLWGGAAALGLILLVGQIAWLQFDELSRRQPYRDLYAAVCPILNCDLPSLAAPDMIRTSNLVVRSHPEAEGALMVDTILLNTAPFQQPFPDLVLSFSNIHGETLAARRFTPREYLAGELAGRTIMPNNQPVHLSLEIVDPGPEAVNYSAYIPQ